MNGVDVFLPSIQLLDALRNEYPQRLDSILNYRDVREENGGVRMRLRQQCRSRVAALEAPTTSHYRSAVQGRVE
jgi:hypothetical protein